MPQTPEERAQEILDATTYINQSGSVGYVARVNRAIVLVSKDEINNIRQWLESFKAEVALASSLADLKTRVASLSSMPNRTSSQAKTAIINKLSDTDCD